MFEPKATAPHLDSTKTRLAFYVGFQAGPDVSASEG